MNTQMVTRSGPSPVATPRSPLPHRSINLWITAALVAAIGLAIYVGREASRQRQEIQRLRQEQAVLARQIQQLQGERDDAIARLAASSAKPSLRLPAPPMHASGPTPDLADRMRSTNLFAGFQGLKNKAPNKLSAAQLESYLKAHGRNAASLLSAYRTTGDAAFLQEAMQNSPTNPQVALAAVLQKDVSPETRRQWLETFKQADPDNALPFYLSALNYLQASQTDLAVPDLMAASAKPQFQDYSAQRLQTDEQLYLAAGYSMAEARAMAPLQEALDFASRDEEAVGDTFATFQSQISSLSPVKALAVSLRDLANSYQQSGDSASADAALQMIVNLGQHYTDTANENGLSQLVGTAAEAIGLYGMDTNSFYDDGETVQDRINQLRQQRAAIRGLYQEAAPLLGTLSDQDWTDYGNRVQYFGEPAALQWVVGKYGQKND